MTVKAIFSRCCGSLMLGVVPGLFGVKELGNRQAFDGHEGLDTRRVAELEEEMKGIKAKIKSLAMSMNLEP